LILNLFYFFGKGDEWNIFIFFRKIKGVISKGIPGDFIKFLNGPNEIFLYFQRRAGKFFQKKEIAPSWGGSWGNGPT
jgi:hypothetical protein